jgi:hypothetical protein
VYLLDRWVQDAKTKIQAATHDDVYSNGGGIRLEAPTCEVAAVALLDSIWLVLREDTTTSLEYFGDHVPWDVADYLHVGLTYHMYATLHRCIVFPANKL